MIKRFLQRWLGIQELSDSQAVTRKHVDGIAEMVGYGKLGFEALTFRGIPIAPDHDNIAPPDGQMYMLNTDTMHFGNPNDLPLPGTTVTPTHHQFTPGEAAQVADQLLTSNVLTERIVRGYERRT